MPPPSDFLNLHDYNTSSIDVCANDCKNPHTSRCTGCFQVFYCGRQCQLAHWQAHKPICQQSDVRSLTSRGQNACKLLTAFSNRYAHFFNEAIPLILKSQNQTDLLVELTLTKKAAHLDDGTNIIRVLQIHEITASCGNRHLRVQSSEATPRIIFQLDCGDGIASDSTHRRHLFLSHTIVPLDSYWWKEVFPSEEDAEQNIWRALGSINRMLYTPRS